MNQQHKIIIGVGIAMLLVAAGVVYYDFARHKESPSTQNGNQVEPPTHTNVRLFYYNENKDKELSGGDNRFYGMESILPVGREMHVSRTPIQDTINLLIKGELTAAERAAGFTTEFPNTDFKLLSANLKNGVLTLEFTEVPGFTTGGSYRISILANQIIKTAKQFPEVKEVRFKPEELFQP
jgi:spore germination protein GerM